MLWSLAKVVVFFAVIAALAVIASFVSDTGGTLRLWIGGMEFTLGPLQAIIAFMIFVALVWVLIRLIAFAFALFRFLNGDETAITRYFDRNRERRGYAALTEGMVALAAGEHTLALARARTAERLLGKPELTTLLTAQAAEAAGDTKSALAAYRALLENESTRFVAIRGLLRQKLAEGDTATALKLAERAFALKPRHAETQDLLLKLQAGNADWKGARTTLSEKLRSGSLPRSVYRRRDALLALQEAKTILDEGSSMEAREAAIEANRMSPDLIPAAVIAARAMAEKGDHKGAARVLKKAWEVQPHPDLAAAFAVIEPDETPVARLKRFKALLALRPQDEETRLTQAELLLAAEDFAAARKALGNLADEHPTQRSLAILAAVERGTGADDATVRALLSRALTASRGPQWCCDKCQSVHGEWQPICPVCDGFDTLSWREPPEDRQARSSAPADLAPLLFGRSTSDPLPEPAPEPKADTAPAPHPASTMTEPHADYADPLPDDTGPTPDEILRRAN